jgi:hypothetical protein
MRAHRHFEGLLEFIMSSFSIGMDARFSRTIDAMARAVVRLLLGVSGLLLCSSSCLAGGLPPQYEDFIASTLAPTQDFSVLYPLYGYDSASYIQTGTYTSSGWSNSILSIYDHQQYIMNYSGSYNSISNAVTWSGSGSYGASQVSTMGTLNFNYPTEMFTLSLSGVIGSSSYSMSGSFGYDYNPNDPAHFTYSGSGSAYLDGLLAGTFTISEEMTSGVQELQSNENWDAMRSIVITSPPLIPVPEIDPGSMAGALTLLVGGVLTLTGRRGRQSLSLASCGAW